MSQQVLDRLLIKSYCIRKDLLADKTLSSTVFRAGPPLFLIWMSWNQSLERKQHAMTYLSFFTVIQHFLVWSTYQYVCESSLHVEFGSRWTRAPDRTALSWKGLWIHRRWVRIVTHGRFPPHVCSAHSRRYCTSSWVQCTSLALHLNTTQKFNWARNRQLARKIKQS